MQQLLQGLAAVQAANVSHRDVKPENLLVRPAAAAAAAASGTTAPAAAAAAAADLNGESQHQTQEQHDPGHQPNADTPKNNGTSSSSDKPLSPDPLSLHLRLIDFGSALDPGSIAAGLYGRQQATVAGGEGAEGGGGPSLDELTLEYAPPEVIFSSRYAAGFVG
jgi:serine/threonine protein kinase